MRNPAWRLFQELYHETFRQSTAQSGKNLVNEEILFKGFIDRVLKRSYRFCP
jgi:hypothetical protein